MAKSPQKTQSLIEEMAANNYQWANERSNPRQQVGMIETDAINMLSIQMNNMMQMLRRQTGCGLSSSTNAYVTCCSIYGGEHDSNECMDVEQAQFVKNYNRNV